MIDGQLDAISYQVAWRSEWVYARSMPYNKKRTEAFFAGRSSRSPALFHLVINDCTEEIQGGACASLLLLTQADYLILRCLRYQIEVVGSQDPSGQFMVIH